MIIKTTSVWLIMAGFFTLCSGILCASSYYPKALPTEAGGSICSLSRKLKEVAPWTQEQLETLRKTRDAYASKFLDWQLYFHGSPECEVNESILGKILTALVTVNKQLPELHTKAILAGALAARSAGRLDEFITVFARARGDGPTFYEKSSFCFGYKGHPATRADLHDCFPTGSRFEIGETNLAKIPESTVDRGEPNLASVIKNITHSALYGHWYRYAMDSAAGCNLIKGACDGILKSVNLEKPLWWGGGILTLGKNFSGQMGRDEFGPGEIANTKDITANWTASPHTIPHLQRTLDAFQ
ncbi:unnamed protein product, partial [Trypanosoma congolense IL3000]